RTFAPWTSLAASERDFTARAKNSHLSILWRPSATILLLELIPQRCELGEWRIRIDLHRTFFARLVATGTIVATLIVAEPVVAPARLALEVAALLALAFRTTTTFAPRALGLRSAAIVGVATLLLVGLPLPLSLSLALSLTLPMALLTVTRTTFEAGRTPEQNQL